jgi:N-acetylmuramoyl-L-alanine amidase
MGMYRFFSILAATLFYTTVAASGNQELSSDKYRKAAEYYNKHVRFGKNIERKKYMASIDRFKEVYTGYPKGEKAPEALFMTGKIYQDLYKTHKNSSDRENAITIFRVLVKGHSYSTLADDALYRTGEIYNLDGDIRNALSSYRGVLRWFPKGDMAGKAKEKIKNLSEKIGVKDPLRPIPRAQARRKKTTKAATLHTVRYWTSDTYARVVFDISSMVSYRLSGTETGKKIVVELLGVKLDERSKDSEKNATGIIKKISIKQRTDDMIRVTLNLTSDHQVTTMELGDPSRIVMDINAKEEGAEIAVFAEPETVIKAEPEIPVKSLSKVEKIIPTAKGGKGLAVAVASKTAKEVAKTAVAVLTKATLQTAKSSAQSGLSRPDKALVEAGLIRTPTNIKREKRQAKKVVRKRSAKPAAKTKKETRQAKAAPTRYSSRTIVIDPGHGGKDPGAVGRSGLKEKDVTLDIGIRLRRILKNQCKCRVLMTRTKDVSIPLEERTAFANTSNADLFISIHVNANPKRNAKGVETYFLSPARSRAEMYTAARENMVAMSNGNVESNDISFILSDMSNTDKINRSSEMAGDVQTALVRTLRSKKYKTKDNGVKSAMFYVLHGARMPSVLVETAFISNGPEEKRLKSAAFREQVASGIAHGVKKFVSDARLAAAR